MSELLSGGHLGDRVRSEGPYKLNEAAQVAKQVCSAVAFLHQQEVVHLSIKPEHVLLESFDDHVTVRLAGFGSARYMSDLDDFPTHFDTVVGLLYLFFVHDAQVLHFSFLCLLLVLICRTSICLQRW